MKDLVCNRLISTRFVCSKCNYSVAEEHIMKPKRLGSYCTVCGYDTTSSGEITLGTGEHTH